MYGHNNHFRPGGGGGGGGGHRPGQPPVPPPGRPPAPPMNPNFGLQNPNSYLPDPNLQFLQNLATLALQAQNPNFAYQNPNFPIQNPNFQFQHQNFPPQQQQQQQVPNPNYHQQQTQHQHFPPQQQQQQQQQQIPNPNFHQQQPQTQTQTQNFSQNLREVTDKKQEVPKPSYEKPQTQSLSQKPRKVSERNPKELLERVDSAVTKARCDLHAAKEHVSASKVVQNALLALKIDSWNSLGFRMQEVPSLYRLMLTEGKVNAFIHCFVGVQRITSLFDLEVTICKNEGIQQFEELELGPLLRHPLILHYFSVNSDTTEVSKITCEEIILYLSKFLSKFIRKKEIRTDEFLDFIAKKRSVMGKEKLGVRIQSLGMHIAFIREAWRSENATLKKYTGGLQKISDHKRKKRPLFSSQKQQIDQRYHAITDRIKSFSSEHTDFCGKHIRFASSSSEDEDGGDCTYEDTKNDNDVATHLKLSGKNINGSDRVSSCPYPSAIEEMTRLGLKGEMDGHLSPASGRSSHCESSGSFKKKRKYENMSCSISAPAKLLKTGKVKQDVCSFENGNETKEVSNLSEADITISNNSMRFFITTWKEACRDHTVAEVS